MKGSGFISRCICLLLIFLALLPAAVGETVDLSAEGGKGQQILWNVVAAPEEGEEPDTLFITLNEGDQLKLGVPFTLTIMSGATFQ